MNKKNPQKDNLAVLILAGKVNLPNYNFKSHEYLFNIGNCLVLEKILKNELEELVNELDEVKKEIDTKNEVVKEFNELAKEMNYLHEETVEKKNELYELKQVIRKLREENF